MCLALTNFSEVTSSPPISHKTKISDNSFAFPALGTGYMFSRAWHRFVFSRALIRRRVFPLLKLRSADWSVKPLRKHSCGNIAPLKTKNVSELFQKHFVSATNFACPRKQGNIFSETFYVMFSPQNSASVIERFSMTFTANVRFTFMFSQNK